MQLHLDEKIIPEAGLSPILVYGVFSCFFLSGRGHIVNSRNGKLQNWLKQWLRYGSLPIATDLQPTTSLPHALSRGGNPCMRYDYSSLRFLQEKNPDYKTELSCLGWFGSCLKSDEFRRGWVCSLWLLNYFFGRQFLCAQGTVPNKRRIQFVTRCVKNYNQVFQSAVLENKGLRFCLRLMIRPTPVLT